MDADLCVLPLGEGHADRVVGLQGMGVEVFGALDDGGEGVVRLLPEPATTGRPLSHVDAEVLEVTGELVVCRVQIRGAGDLLPLLERIAIGQRSIGRIVLDGIAQINVSILTDIEVDNPGVSNAGGTFEEVDGVVVLLAVLTLILSSH